MGKLNYNGRVAVVTGAGAGLGREYALLLASRGAKVVVNDLGGDRNGQGQSSKQADVVVNEIIANGGIAVANYDSVTDGEKIIKTALDNFGRIDILVNNAGILRDRSFPRISEQDWNLINDVHLKGSFKTTQAAWPIFKKQNYGRVIMTSSTSGIYGNFGQANYSAAKLGLIGLANTLAIEGAKYNIHCNVIVPVAASRLTQDIFPEDLFNQLKPKLIAPVVAYLCHESNDDNGVIIESGGGWAAKHKDYCSKGTFLRTSIEEDVDLDYVQKVWNDVTDMKTAEAMNHQMSSKNLLGALEKLKDKQSMDIESTFRFGNKDLIVYALGIGATVKDLQDLSFLYESHADFAPLPTFFVLPAMQLSFESGIVSSAITHTKFGLSQILHGEQYIEIFGDLPTEGELITKAYVVDVMDKKSGAVVVINSETFDKSGNLLVKNQVSTFIIGAGNFNGKTKPSDKVISTVSAPNRPFDKSIQLKTSVDQAALYRLSGDLNPLHIDPDFAKLGGQPVPILHGLCTLGFSMRAVLRTYANNDSSNFKAMKVRFVKPVIPGQTLKVDMWKNGKRIYFKTSIVETGVEVITGAYVDLKMDVTPNLTSAEVALQSDAIFERIAERVAADPAKAKAVNGVFLYKITVDGKVVNHWTIDLKNATVYRSEPKDIKADTTLTVADQDMVDIALGKLNAQVAFMKGKLKITGNIMLTQKLVPLLKAEAKL